MFTHMKTKGQWPWDDGIEPDAKNDIAEVYVEPNYTKYLTHDRNHQAIPSMAKWYVAMVRFLASDEVKWIIHDGIGVLDDYTALEPLFYGCDKWKLVEHGKV